MVTLTEIECDDNVRTVDIRIKCRPCGDGDLGTAAADVDGCCDEGGNVGYGDSLCEVVDGSAEVIRDDQRSAECSESETDWVAAGSAALKVVLGVSSGEIGEVVLKPIDVELRLKDTNSVGSDVELETVKEIVEVIENDKKSEIVVMENDDDDPAISVNANEHPLKTEATDDPIINLSAVSQFVEVNVDETQAENTDVEVIEDDKKSEIVVMENDDDAAISVNVDEQLLETEATDDPIINLSTVSQFVEVNVDETQAENTEEVFLEKDISSHCSNEGTDYKTEVEICDDSEHAQFEVKEDPDTDQVTLIFPASLVSHGMNIQFGSFGQTVDTKSETKVSNPETEQEYDVNINDHEQSIIDLLEDDSNVACAGDIDDGQRAGFRNNVHTEVYEDEKLNELIKNAQLQLDEKTRYKDAIMAEMHINWKNIILYNEALNAKNLKLISTSRLVESTRQEIDHVRCVLNKIKNAIAVDEIDSRINIAEHMIKQETLCFEDEKQFIREIKQLKSMRAHLASNMGKPDEHQSMLDQKDQVEELLESLNAELKTCKHKVSKALVASDTLRQKYAEELKMERVLKAQLLAAEKSHHEADWHLFSLEKQLSHKNKSFHMYKKALDVFPDDTNEKAASNSGSTPDEVKSISEVTNLETEKTVKSVEEKHADDQNKENVLEEFEQIVKNKEPNEHAEIKIDELMKEKIEAELKERIRLEEKMEANETNERKKQNAQKAQTRAQIQAQKQAQQKENLRLKRLRKRERKRAAKGGTSATIDDPGVAGSNKPKQIENTNGKLQQQPPPPPPRFLRRQLKPKFIPPPPAMVAAIRNRKPWRHWRSIIISSVMVLILSVFFI